MTRKTLSSSVQVLHKTGIQVLDSGKAKAEKSGICNVWDLTGALTLLPLREEEDASAGALLLCNSLRLLCDEVCNGCGGIRSSSRGAEVICEWEKGGSGLCIASCACASAAVFASVTANTYIYIRILISCSPVYCMDK